MHDLFSTLATSVPADPAQQQAAGRGVLLLMLLALVGLLGLLGLIVAGFVWHSRQQPDTPEREESHKDVDAWAESARRATIDDGSPEDDEDWEADED